MEVSKNTLTPEQLAAQQIKRSQLQHIKSDIKKRVEEQRLYKDQRRSVHNKRERVYPPSAAAKLHAENRYHLHHLYIVSNAMRGHELSRIFGAKADQVKYEDQFFNRLKEHYESDQTVHYYS